MNTPIHTPNAPAPIGPYNQAILAGNTLYVSGQIGINAETGDLITHSINSETKQVLENLKAILHAADFNLKQVVKTTIFLSKMEYFTAVNEVYATYFDDKTAPARACVAVQTLPKNVNVEISAIAVR